MLLTFLMPEVCVSSCCTVTLASGPLSAGSSDSKQASSCNLPACTSCRTAKAVNCLLTEASRNAASGCMATPFSMSAMP